MQRPELERLSREELIEEASRVGVGRPRSLTQAELVDEILTRTTTGDRERARVRGWLGRARDLLARVVERGLHLPEAARSLRRESEEKGWPPPPPPLPTVTLAEIYAAQGHLERALTVLDEVLAREPEHKEAKILRARFVEQQERRRVRQGRETPARPDEPAESAAEAASAIAEPSKEEARVEPTPTASDAKTGVQVAPSSSSFAEVAPDHPAHAETKPADVEAAAPPDPVAPVAEAALVLALPESYEVDEVVAVAVDPRTLYLYWEVRATTLAHAQAGQPEGRLALRVAAVVPSWEGPLVEARDILVDALHGDRFVEGVRPGSLVRVSVGWLTGASFEPFAVGAEVTAPRVTPVETVAQEVARWEAAPAVAAFTTPSPRAARAPQANGASEPEPSFGPIEEAPPALRWPRPRANADVGASFGAPRGAAPIDTGVTTWSSEPRAHVESFLAAGGASDLVRRTRSQGAPLATSSGSFALG